MKINPIALACSAALVGLSATAQAEFSANIGVTSNYLWRGVSQTADGPAISGGIDYAHDSGFYAGTWASNIEGDTGTAYELDLYGGYAGEYNDFGYDVGLIYYAYPDSDTEDWDFYEIYAGGSYKWFGAGLAYTFGGDGDSDAQFNSGDIYYYANAAFDIAEGWSIGGTIGYYDFDVPDSSDVDYAHYQLDLTRGAGDFGDFTFTVSTADKESGDDDNKVVVSWAKSF
jgi:uncharacterized protein (TIGR02001 family)